MEECINLLNEQLALIDKLLKEVDLRLERDRKVPDSSETVKTTVNTSISNGCPQYYLRTGSSPKVYAGKADMPRVKRIVQHDYDIAVHEAMLETRALLAKFISQYDPDIVRHVYENMSEARKRLVKSLLPTDTEFIESWLQDNPSVGNPYHEERVYQTDSGEMVRSKSEKIIADLLHRNHIPYQYEPKLEFRRGQLVFPDFAVLNVRKRKTIYWEHLGMISDGEYASKALHKIMEYESNGYYLGEDLIITMESDITPLNMKMIEKKIGKYIL